MDYERLADFVENRMRMSHVYQPVMLLTLLRGGGSSSTADITRTILAHDESQVEYYEDVTKNMVGRALRRHGIVEKDGGGYSLVGYGELDGEQVGRLIGLCEVKLDEYKARRGRRIWQHRRVSGGYVSGTLRYEVLKRARFRCELCGVSADVRALEADHIVPRSRGGADDPDNLQALCYRCNASKCDRDDADFRGVAEAYGRREPGCPFCEIPLDRVVAGNELAHAVRDAYPVTPLHTLVIPKRHARGYFDLGRAELNACHGLLEQQREAISRADVRVGGFNVGVNDGPVAGQTVSHCHLHLIPRREGDVEDPTGGVRNAVPGKGAYRRPPSRPRPTPAKASREEAVSGAEIAREFVEKGWQIRYRGGNSVCSTPSDLDLIVADAPGDNPKHSIAAWPPSAGLAEGPGGPLSTSTTPNGRSPCGCAVSPRPGWRRSFWRGTARRRTRRGTLPCGTRRRYRRRPRDRSVPGHPPRGLPFALRAGRVGDRR